MNYLKYLLVLIFFNSYAQSKVITIESRRNKDKSVDLLYEKTAPGSWTVVINFSRLENAVIRGYGGKTNHNRYVGVVDGTSGSLLKLAPANNDESVGYNFSYRFYFGTYEAKVDEDFAYVLPFAKGSSVQVIQLDNVSEKYFKNKKMNNWYSYGFRSRDNDTVLAIRMGKVIKIENSGEANKNTSYSTEANKVHIEHKDGSVARYSGFIKGTILVKPNQIVYPHTPIGLISTEEDRGQAMMKLYINYLTDISKNNSGEKRTLSTAKSRYSYVLPHFMTVSGLKKPEKKNSTFISDINEDIFVKEFNKRKLKKLKKGLITKTY